jgi:20S proteasome alpha/beta subunit
MKSKNLKVKAIVTILIGLKSNDSIILVADSRTTEDTGLVRDNAQKIFVVTFNDGNSVLVGCAGNDMLSKRVLECLQHKAPTRPLDDYRAAADLVQECVSEVKGVMRGQFHGTSEELQRHFADYSFELMIAHYWQGKPQIFTLLFEQGIAVSQEKLYLALGCAAPLADYLIRPLDMRQYREDHMLWTGLFAVETIKDVDPRCGGPTQSGVVNFKDGKSIAKPASEQWLQRTAVSVNEFAQMERAAWKGRIETAISDFMKAARSRGDFYK